VNPAARATPMRSRNRGLVSEFGHEHGHEHGQDARSARQAGPGTTAHHPELSLAGHRATDVIRPDSA
jgi:hypothetical protein